MAASDAIPVPRKFTAYRVTFPIHDANGNPIAAATVDTGYELSIDGGAFAHLDTGKFSEVGSGFYNLDLDTGDMQGDTVAVSVENSQKTTGIVLYPEELGDIRVNAGQINGDTGAAAHLAQLGDEYDTGQLAADLSSVTAKLDTGVPASINTPIQNKLDTGVPSSVWASATRTLTAFAFDTGVQQKLDRLDTGLSETIDRIEDYDTGLRQLINRFDTGVSAKTDQTYAKVDTGISAEITAISTVVSQADTGIRQQTDKLTFDTGGNELHADIRKVNNIQVKGAGDTGTGDFWRPVTEV